MSMLYKIEGYEGCYCPECVKKIMDEYRMQILARLVPDSDDVEDLIYTATDECRTAGITSYAETNPIKLS